MPMSRRVRVRRHVMRTQRGRVVPRREHRRRVNAPLVPPLTRPYKGRRLLYIRRHDANGKMYWMPLKRRITDANGNIIWTDIPSSESTTMSLRKEPNRHNVFLPKGGPPFGIESQAEASETLASRTKQAREEEEEGMSEIGKPYRFNPASKVIMSDEDKVSGERWLAEQYQKNLHPAPLDLSKMSNAEIEALYYTSKPLAPTVSIPRSLLEWAKARRRKTR
jgi:hypothetical protein